MRYSNPKVPSSYRENDLGQTLYDLVIKEKPETIIEFGTLHGYSAIAMAMALHELGKGHITSYDLWDDYRYNTGKKSVVQDVIDELGLTEYITLSKGDLKSWTPEPFDLLHVDISNDGEKIAMLNNKVKGMDGLVIFEGGSLERDTVGWMSKYNKMPIRQSGVRFDVIEEKFPSISKLI